jgi:hypothetical protein
VISLDITQCHDRTVPKLSQRPLLDPELPVTILLKRPLKSGIAVVAWHD